MYKIEWEGASECLIWDKAKIPSYLLSFTYPLFTSNWKKSSTSCSPHHKEWSGFCDITPRLKLAKPFLSQTFHFFTASHLPEPRTGTSSVVIQLLTSDLHSLKIWGRSGRSFFFFFTFGSHCRVYVYVELCHRTEDQNFGRPHHRVLFQTSTLTNINCMHVLIGVKARLKDKNGKFAVCLRTKDVRC